jgi:hypothetical protein
MASNLYDKLPKHLQNLISQFNCDHRAALAPSLMRIQEHRKCAFCDCVIRGVETIYPNVRFFCDTMCRDSWDYELSVQQYEDECRANNPDLDMWMILNSCS